jgi:tetratricopeptide (TPR) repeat protein
VTTHGDFVIGRIALERGLLSVDQLAECLGEQKTAPASTLGAIMLRKGLLKQTDLDSLLEEQKQRLADALELSDPKLEDALLGRLLIRQGVVKEAQVYECLRASAEMAEAGEKAPRLGELLVRKGFLAVDAAERALLPPPKKEGLVCPACHNSFTAVALDPGKKYTCKHCGHVLERHEKLSPKEETTESIKIGMPDDAAKVLKDPARQFAGGKYLLVEEVGRGGMGVVWKAWQVDLRRYVAIKILVGTMWTDVELKRFYREAQMAASLSHPNIASIYEVGAHDGKHYIAMEFVEGDSLARLIAPPTNKQGTARAVKHLPPRRAIEILREAALAADYAHSKKIIHRDLKPHNIMVQRTDGRVYVMDFGLAKPIKAQDSITMSDAIVGTPQYMSPEQARGEAVDRRTDLFSLGAVLYHVLTGHPPFDGRSPAEVMMSVLADDPPPMRKLNSRIHADVETICLKALDKDRHRRYDSARSLADDLGRYLEGEPISARPLSRREKFWREARRRPILSALLAAAGAALLLIAAIFLVLHWRTQARIGEFIDEARELNRQGKYDDAKAACEKVFGHDPENEEAMTVWAFAEEKRLEGQRESERLRARAERDLERDFKEADTFYKAGLFQAALQIYERILGSPYKRNDALANERKVQCMEALAKKDEEAVNTKEALEDERRAQKDREEELQRRQKARAVAITYYEAARLAVDKAARMRLRADGYSVADIRELYQEARDALTKALTTDDTYSEAYFFRGQLRHKMGDYLLAVADFKNAKDRSLESGPAPFGASTAYLALYVLHAHTPDVPDRDARNESMARMLEWARVAADKSQSPFDRFAAAALIDLQKRDFDKAQDKLKTVAESGKANFFWHFIRGAVAAEALDFRTAERELTSALELEPASLEAYFLRAAIRIRTENLAGALDDARLAVEAAPAPAERAILYAVHSLRAHVHHELNDQDKAIQDLRKALNYAGPLAGQVSTLISRWEREAKPEK